MPSNLELKARVTSLEQSREAAIRCGAVFQYVMAQVDTYFQVRHGRMKLREIDGRSAELIGYDRVEDGGDRVSKFERIAVGDPAATKALFIERLGVLAVVRKRRELWLLDRTRIHLDQVEELGDFVEFEIPVEEGRDMTAELRRLRSVFHIDLAQEKGNSYSDMIVEISSKSSREKQPPTTD